MSAPIRVAVCIPAMDDVKTDFAFDLANMVGATVASRTDVDLRLHVIRTSLIQMSRERLVLKALSSDCTHVLFLDSDMSFPRHALLQLLARNEYIVGANYPTRRPPVRPVTFATDDDASVRVYTEADATDCTEVASIGFGCVLIDLDVFRAMSRPWFNVVWDEDKRDFTGEDVWFCRKAREELGATILIDHQLSQDIGHIGEFKYTLEHARAYRDAA